jgi:predicted short-subunit dehydrogenase-like oxidoreductase (DUF2520 family)
MAIMNILIVGAGRAGSSFEAALRAVGHHVTMVHHRELLGSSHSPQGLEPIDADLVLLCVPDDAVAALSDLLLVADSTVVAHVAGSMGLEVLRAGRGRAQRKNDARVGSLHPLITMPDARVGAQRLRGAAFAVEGDPLLHEVVASLGGRVITVAPEHRALYHAAAVSAANHLVALMGSLEVLARGAGLALQDFLPLAHQALDDVDVSGPLLALTGPASRGDTETIRRHLLVVPDEERATYVALSERAARLAHTDLAPVNDVAVRDATTDLTPADVVP